MNKTSLFRAYCDWPYVTAVFVEANDRQSASLKISRLIGTLYGCQPDDVSFYNLDSYRELIDEKGVDDDQDFRLFESGWDADGVASWVESPLFPCAPESIVPTGRMGAAAVPSGRFGLSGAARAGPPSYASGSHRRWPGRPAKALLHAPTRRAGALRASGPSPGLKSPAQAAQPPQEAF
jgi:hypothetical protein